MSNVKNRQPVQKHIDFSPFKIEWDVYEVEYVATHPDHPELEGRGDTQREAYGRIRRKIEKHEGEKQ